MRRWGFWLVVLTYSAVVVCAVDNDWDQFLSFLEAERRAWLLDWRPPVWSYQLCAGGTRIGDPQSFGLSPVFLPVLLLGSFWGAKAMVVLCALIGYTFLAKLLALLDPSGPLAETADDRRAVHSSLSLFFNFGAYFFWHLHIGQLTFALMQFLFLPVYYLAKGCLRGLDRGERTILLLSTFAYCTAGFYHSLVFLLIPGGLLFAILAPVHILRTGSMRALLDPAVRERARATLGTVGIACALSSYKWLAVLQYQHHFPRSQFQRFDETSSLHQLLVYYLVPVWNLRFGGIHQGWGPWAIFEYSAYSAIPWIGLGLFCVVAATWRARRPSARSLGAGPGPELLAALAVATLLSLGDSSPVPLHGLMNRSIYGDSVRVSARYEILPLFILLLLLLRTLARHPGARRIYVKHMVPAGVALTAANVVTFIPYMSPARALEVANAPAVEIQEMRTWHFVPDRVTERFPGMSHMYRTVLAGEIVPNCYQGVSMPLALVNESERSEVLPPPVDQRLDLLDAGDSPVSDECRRSAYVTQNALRFDPGACPDDLCFRINAPNLHWMPPVVWNRDRGLYCAR